MTGKADSAISRLFSSAETLNSVSDQITAQIQEVEDQLAKKGIGVEAWVEVSRWSEVSDQYELGYVASLGYAKHKGKWGLLYSEWCEETESGETKFLRDASRDIRIGALQKLPVLFDKLNEETQKLIEKANKNLADAKAFAAALKGNGRR